MIQGQTINLVSPSCILVIKFTKQDNEIPIKENLKRHSIDNLFIIYE